MIFNKPTLFIDPSYTCTGLCLVDSKAKTLVFDGISRAETKKDLHHYYEAAKNLRGLLVSRLEDIHKMYPEGFDVVMEAPFPGSYASSGLYMLQAYFLDALHSYSDYGMTFYSLSPSYISGQIKRENGKKDSIGIRKKWCLEKLNELQSKGWTVENVRILKAAGADPQTAFGFWYFLATSDKSLEAFNL